MTVDSPAAERAVEDFVHAYGDHLMGLAPGSNCGIREYAVKDWGVTKVSGDGNAVLAWFELAFFPNDFENTFLWAGNTCEGTGEFAGMLVFSRQLVLQKLDDGRWHCIGFGTGGYTLP